VRRRFLDVMLSLTSRAYLIALQRYRVALAHRNASMRETAVGSAALEARVAIWEPALAENGALLWRARRAWVVEHAAHYGELCAAIGERGASRLRYVSHLDADDAGAQQALRAALERRRGLDIRRGVTLVGPHRDDLELALDNRDLRTYGSAGQQRTAAIALRLLEAATIRAHAGSEPVVLLDDPFAELDSRRAARILDLLNAEGRGQTILAVPRESDIPAGLTRLERWRIADGALTPDVR
jgi:DNA replication and repair protein RecF